ncbi:MAG: hypothetical protein GXO79_01450 [Chlorobi bacterium]|nr:hypothetical protein [Chlorobiota bacterium]
MEILQNNKAQLKLFSILQEKIPENFSLVDVISDLLQISNDSAYRRIRGETALSIDEAAAICGKYNISFDDNINTAIPSASFRYNPLTDKSHFKEFLTSIRNDMQMIKKADDPKIIWAAIDIPIFHHFRYPNLSAFKMFYWLTAVINEPTLLSQKFDINIVDKELTKIGSQIYELYKEIPSIEIWSDATILSLIKQIEFYWDSGMFENKTNALKVCDEAYTQFVNIQKQAEAKKKVPEDTGETATSFELYYSDIEIGNNCIQISVGNRKNIYLSFNTFNALVSGNQQFCETTNNWLLNLISKATLISGVSEKIRNQFFSKALDSMKALITKIETE